MTTSIERAASKVPAVTLAFWIVKIAATTLGETAGDAVSMSMQLGYLAATTIFAAIFLLAVGAQITAKRFHPLVYWVTVVTTRLSAPHSRTSPTARSASAMPAAHRSCSRW